MHTKLHVSSHKYIDLTRVFVSKAILPSLSAIREGLLWLVPCLMISSLILFIAAIGEFVYGYRPSWVQYFFSIHDEITTALPYLLSAAISYILAMQWRLPRPPVALLSIVFLILLRNSLGDSQLVLTFSVIMAVVTPLYAIPILAMLLKVKWLKLVKLDSAGQIVKESLNLVLPAIITGMVVLLINFVLIHFLEGLAFGHVIFFDYANEPFEFGLTFAALNSTLWFLGIHGYYALLPFVDVLQEASNLNYSVASAGGDASYQMNLSFMGSFVFIGGSGATLSLVLAMLVVCKEKTLRLIAVASIPIGLVNVNELLLFGLPIIFNPRLFLPFLIVPLVNVVTGLTATELGWVSVPSASIPFNSPILVNAWIATSGDFGAIALQVTNILLGALIYLPAVLHLEKQFQTRSIRFTALDTTYMRRKEEAETLSDDPILAAQKKEKGLASVEFHLEAISSKEFFVEYQPQICRKTGVVKGCEALIRAKDPEGNIEPPIKFLPWLEKANMMKDIDLWVVNQVIKDIEAWQRQGRDLHVTVNITADTLVDDAYIDRILTLIERVKGKVNFEITEETLLVDEKQLAMVFNRLALAGIKLYIDDFGTGYSSLSYLNRFDIAAIKIDRSFVLALNTSKGQMLFDSMLTIADKLDLDVVVEGVETQEQLDFISVSDRVSVQGWYYSRSLPRDRFIDYVDQTHRLSDSLSLAKNLD